MNAKFLERKVFVNHAPHEAKKSGWLLREPQPGGSFGNLIECDKLMGHLVDSFESISGDHH